MIKMKKTGRITYVPRVIIDEINNIKIEEGIESSAEAFKKMSNYSKIGREAIVKNNDIPLGRKTRKWF